MRKLLYRIYWKLESIITPGLLSSQEQYARTLDQSVKRATRWLDVGCGHQVFPEWIRSVREEDLVNRAQEVHGIDPDAASIAEHRSIRNKSVGTDLLQFGPESFDLVTANMVVEHLEHPENFLQQVKTILRPSGRFIFHTPNIRNPRVWFGSLLSDTIKRTLIPLMEDREAKDVYPTFYRANTREDVISLANKVGLEVMELKMLDTSSTSRIFLGPVAIVELISIRLRRNPKREGRRSNMIVIMERPKS